MKSLGKVSQSDFVAAGITSDVEWIRNAETAQASKVCRVCWSADKALCEKSSPKLVLYDALTVHCCLCLCLYQSKRFVERLCKVWWLSCVQQIEGGHQTKVCWRIRHVRSFGHTSMQNDPTSAIQVDHSTVYMTHARTRFLIKTLWSSQRSVLCHPFLENIDS